MTNSSDRSVRQGLLALGGDPDRLLHAGRAGEIAAYFELHIEQGGVLDTRSITIGVVEGIVGVYWWDVVVEGVANHAGTTPMAGRRDALVAAARFVLAVERVVSSAPGRAVGTVGRIRAEPGAPNVIPGRVVMSLELRDLAAAKVFALRDEIEKEARSIAGETGTTIHIVPIDADAKPAPTDPALVELIAGVARDLGFDSLKMPSGAGHDAQNIAAVAPIGMIFVPSVGGVSHAPRERTRLTDLAAGTAVLIEAVRRADQMYMTFIIAGRDRFWP